MKHIVSLALLCVVLIITQASCGVNQVKQVSDSGFYLDTQCNITIYDMEEKAATKHIENALALCGEYETFLSKTIEGSDIYRLNHAEGNAVRVADCTIELLEMGIRMGKESEGRFDITIGRLTDLWDFKSEAPKVPDKGKIEKALKTVDYHNIVIAGNDVSLKNDCRVDLGGIAKGYISSKVAEQLQKDGVEHAIINLGGNVVALGNKPGETMWNVGIQDPNKEAQTIIGTTQAKNQAVITSGIYERKFKQNGKTYHHIIDPETGYPVQNNIEGVTIKCTVSDAGICDAYSTICLLMGVEKGKEFIEEKDGFEALFYEKSKKVIRTDGMDFEENENAAGI